MPSFAATVLFLPLLGFCSAKCLPHAVPQASSSPSAANAASSTSPIASEASSTSPIASEAASVPPAGQNATSGSKIPDTFKPGVKWQIEIQNPVDPRAGLQPPDAKVIDVDLFHASKDPTLIPAFHEAGATVLCYFNLGAVQTTDCDFSSWESDGLMKTSQTVENYVQEKYVDVTDATVLELHKSRIDLAHQIGCDGLDPDNIDTFELSADESIGKQITQGDMINFLTTLAEYAHSKTTTLGHTLMIGQKNAWSITEQVHTFMDFAISENCVGSVNVGSNRGAPDEFCTVFQKYYADNGKPAFDIEYPSSLAAGGGSKKRQDESATDGSEGGCAAATSEADITAYCTSQASSTGISRILKLDNDEYGLNGCTQYCDETASFVMTTYPSNDTNSCG